MSGIPPQQTPPSGLQDSLGTKEKLKRMREESAALKEAGRGSKARSNPSSARASPSKSMERQTPLPSTGQAPQFPARIQQQHALPPATQGWQPLNWAGNVQPMPNVSRASSVSSWAGVLQPQSPIRRASIASDRAVSQPTSPLSRGPSAFSRGGIPQPLAPAALAMNQGPRSASSMSSPSSRDQVHIAPQSPGLIQSRASTNTPDIIPSKMPYQVQEEPDRLEVQPAVISTELPLPMRSSQSVPHTPATPSRLSMHEEASSSPQPVTLEMQNLGNMEFVVPLCMQKRILKQYIDTIEFYPKSVRDNLVQKAISEKCLGNLNDLLCRLANVSTHIGLEGGGPSSQESVRSEQEATYAELSSEKFRFLGHLFQSLKQLDFHIAIVAHTGPLHDILELFLKGKRVHYNRPSTYTKSNLGLEGGKLHVSVIASTEEGQPTHFTRAADLVIAFDETFKATNQTVVDLRKRKHVQLTPVVRLVVYSSVEHFDLCLPRTLKPVERIRKLIFCVWHTQKIVGELQDHEPTTDQYADSVTHFLRRGGLPNFWNVPFIRPIVNVPNMDSDSSLSDPPSDLSAKGWNPQAHEASVKYWPDRTHGTGVTSTQVSSSGKRPFVSI